MSVGAIQALAALITVFRGKFVALQLGPGGVGITSVIDQWSQSLAYVAALSLPLVSTRFLSRAHSDGPGAFETVYVTFLKTLFLLSGTASIGAAMLAAWHPWLFGRALVYSQLALIFAFLSFPGAILNGFFSNSLAAAQKPKTSAVVVLLGNLILATAACMGLYLWGISGMYACLAVGSVLVVAAALIYLRCVLHLPFYVRGVSIIREFRREREIAAFAAMQFVATLAFSVTLLLVRNLVLSRFGAVTSGMLQAQMAIAQSISLVLNPPTFTVLLPIVNRRIEPAEKISATNAYLEQFIFVLGTMTLAVMLFPKSALLILFSGRFLSAANSLFLFALYIGFNSIGGAYQTLLIGLGDMRGYFVVTVLGQCGAGLLAFLLIPSFAVTGAGLALLGGAAITLVGCLLRLRVHFSMFLTPRGCVACLGSLFFLGLTGWAASRALELTPTALLIRALLLLLPVIFVLSASTGPHKTLMRSVFASFSTAD